MTEAADTKPQGGQGVATHAHSAEQARAWVGWRLDELGGRAAGWVEGVFVDAASGDPAWLVFRIGRFGRRAAVPFEMAAAGAGRVWVPYPRDLLRAAPEVDPARGLEPERERALCEHYSLGQGSGRLAAIEGRGSEELTSVPL